MNEQHAHGRVQPVASLREYFCDALNGALAHQHVAVQHQTQHYVVELLTLFARSESLKAAGGTSRPLAFVLKDALEASTEAERDHHLQRLGDVSLFIAGFFARGLARRPVGVDYNIAMGGRAYGALATRLRNGRRAVLAQVFAELAGKFQPLVDALNEISESSDAPTSADVLRFYELWLKTGSPRARRILGGLGVTPSEAARTPFAQ